MHGQDVQDGCRIAEMEGAGMKRMEYALRHWFRPIFNQPGSHWVDEKNVWTRKDRAIKICKWTDDAVVVARPKGSSDPWKKVFDPHNKVQEK